MKRLICAAAAGSLLTVAAAQATNGLPSSVQDFVDYVCELEDEGAIPPPFPPEPTVSLIKGPSSSDVIFEEAFDAYVRAGLLDEIPQCENCVYK